MARYVLFAIIFLVSYFRYVSKKSNDEYSAYIPVSFLIQSFYTSCIILNLGNVLYHDGARTGCFDTYYSLDVCLLVFAFIGFPKKKCSSCTFENKNAKYYLLLLVFFEIVTYYNPLAHFKYAGNPLLFRLCQLYIVLKFLVRTIDSKDALNGVFSGFKYAVSVQAIIATLFPLLNVRMITQLFWPDAEFWSMRRGVASAMGTFTHPGTLGLFCSIIAVFFFVCYLYEFKKKESLRYMLLAVYVIFLTYSRTSYVTLAGAMMLIYYVFVRINKLAFDKILAAVFLAFVGCTIVLFFTPFGETLLHSDADLQFENRMIHYTMAYQCFIESPIWGVGINNQVMYAANSMSRSIVGNMPAFFFEAPFHNISLIVLAETGLLGLSCWLYIFISHIRKSFRKVDDLAVQILNISFGGILIVYFVYGLTGWAGFNKEIYPLVLVLGALTSFKKKTLNSW